MRVIHGEALSGRRYPFVLQTDRLLRPVSREERIKSQRFPPSTCFSIRKTRSIYTMRIITQLQSRLISFIDAVHQRENCGEEELPLRGSSVVALCRKKSNAMTWRTNTSCCSSHKPASLLYQCGTTSLRCERFRRRNISSVLPERGFEDAEGKETGRCA